MRYMNQILCFKRMIKPLALAAVLFYSSCSDLLENDNAFFHVSTQEQQWNSLTIPFRSVWYLWLDAYCFG